MRFQKKFLNQTLKNLNCPSIKELKNRGIETSYSTLKNYFSEHRLLPESFFNDLCEISKIDGKKLKVKLFGDNWGRVKGGKISKR